MRMQGWKRPRARWVNDLRTGGCGVAWCQLYDLGCDRFLRVRINERHTSTPLEPLCKPAVCQIRLSAVLKDSPARPSFGCSYLSPTQRGLLQASQGCGRPLCYGL